MANKIKVHLWLHRSKINKDGMVPLIIRLSFQNKKQDKATGYYVYPEQWNITKQRLRGNKENAEEVNGWIDSQIAKVAALYKDALQNNEGIFLPGIMNDLFIKVKEEPTLLQVISDHNTGLKERVNKDYTYSTYEKYVFTYDKVKAFIEKVLKRKDILLREITVKFIMDFDHYLRVQENNQHNTAVKYCLNLKRILNVAVLQGMLIQTPFKTYRTVYKDTPQVYLDEQEVMKVEMLEAKKPSHLLVKDLFLFQCCTGLSYADLISLRVVDISSDFRGRQWIVKARQKTGVTSTIPLLPKAIEILERYIHSKKSHDCIFPHYSIQKYNQYIGEVGQAVGIDKKLSSHVGRRTFGNIALAKGVSLNVISKILGHTNTLITQRIYAITTQNIITQEIEKWGN